MFLSPHLTFICSGVEMQPCSVSACVWKAAPGGLPSAVTILAGILLGQPLSSLLRLKESRTVQRTFQRLAKGKLSVITDHIFGLSIYLCYWLKQAWGWLSGTCVCSKNFTCLTLQFWWIISRLTRPTLTSVTPMGTSRRSFHAKCFQSFSATTSSDGICAWVERFWRTT